ncbi:MAG: hypothetical protein HQL58_08205 [Magnetococcales bacterium]|nr:hypothetical protein [Magnetococcales bacterium]
MARVLMLCTLLVFSWLPQQALAKTAAGSCAHYDFTPFRQGDKLQWNEQARVLRHNAPLYSKSDSKPGDGKPAATVAFNQRLELLADKGERLQVKMQRSGSEATGWMNKSDLLCRNMPLQDDTGLEKKFFIRTATAARNSSQTEPVVRVHPDPDMNQCSSSEAQGQPECRHTASRFHMYFVFDEREQSLLLADRYRLDEDGPLLGWVSKQNGFLWNNAFALRPRADLTADSDQQKPGTICSYEKIDQAVARDSNSCNPIEAGNKWFLSPLRIPVLDMVDSKGRHVDPDNWSGNSEQRLFYKVALSRPGVVGRRVGDGQIAISSGLAERLMPELKSSGLKGLAAKKNVDIFFVIDATASMQSAIDAVRGTGERLGVIQEIIQKLKQTASFQETQFRFGFRVYRDPYADKAVADHPGGGVGDGIGEGLPLPDSCQLSATEQQRNVQAFQDAIAHVKATNEDGDDYEENLYGGLAQALQQDIVACPDHLKLLFIIGDSGYEGGLALDSGGRVVRSSAKYAHPIDETLLVRLLRGSDTKGTKSNSIVPFFIQTPSSESQAKHPRLYRRAYDKFTTQANTLLSQSLPSGVRAEEHLFRMGEEQLVNRLVQTVERFGGSSLIDEIIVDISGGEKLSTIIGRLRREHVDIPGVYWHILNKGACGELGNQCEQQVFDTTLAGYIEANDQVVEELWLPSAALSSWIRVLKGFEGYYELPEAQLRRALISAMILGLQQEIRRPPIDVLGETPAQYAQRRGSLPVRRHSPLLSYLVPALSADQLLRDPTNKKTVVAGMDGKPLMDKNNHPVAAVPACELRRLALWAIQSRQMLEIVERDFRRPQYQSVPWQPSQCPDATANGQALVRINGPIESIPLGPDKNHRFGHVLGGQRGYWVPQEYLP